MLLTKPHAAVAEVVDRVLARRASRGAFVATAAQQDARGQACDDRAAGSVKALLRLYSGSIKAVTCGHVQLTFAQQREQAAAQAKAAHARSAQDTKLALAAERERSRGCGEKCRAGPGIDPSFPVCRCVITFPPRKYITPSHSRLHD